MPKNDPTIFVKPSQPGGVVRFPDDPKRTLAPEGEAVPRSAFWLRRVKDNSVVEVKPAVKAKEAGK